MVTGTGSPAPLLSETCPGESGADGLLSASGLSLHHRARLLRTVESNIPRDHDPDRISGSDGQRRPDIEFA